MYSPQPTCTSLITGSGTYLFETFLTSCTSFTSVLLANLHHISVSKPQFTIHSPQGKASLPQGVCHFARACFPPSLSRILDILQIEVFTFLTSSLYSLNSTERHLVHKPQDLHNSFTTQNQLQTLSAGSLSRLSQFKFRQALFKVLIDTAPKIFDKHIHTPSISIKYIKYINSTYRSRLVSDLHLKAELHFQTRRLTSSFFRKNGSNAQLLPR